MFSYDLVAEEISIGSCGELWQSFFPFTLIYQHSIACIFPNLETFHAKLMHKAEYLVRRQHNMAYPKKSYTTGRTVLNDRGRTCKNLKNWVHCPTGGLATVQEKR